jgi:cytochrome c-type biogenesis protein
MDTVSAAGISFLAGLFAPLGAVCVLPLYPGFLAWMANQAGEGDGRMLLFRFALIVTTGLIFSFLTIGLFFTWLLRTSMSEAIGIISMIAFLFLAGASICLIADIDLSRIIRTPGVLHHRRPYQNALLFGLFFGLIILPCNPAPIILLFALSVNAADFFENIIILVAFCVGIAIPVLLISLIPAATNYSLVRTITANRRKINFVCGLFMLVLALYYLFWVFHLQELMGDACSHFFTGKF